MTLRPPLLLGAAAIGLACGLLGAGIALTFAPPAATDEAGLRAIVETVLDEREPELLALVSEAARAERPAETAALDPVAINPLIESFLMNDPAILQRMSVALDAQRRSEERASTRLALAQVETELYSTTDQVILGNPEGDVTLVELYDYNCGYCRQSMPDIARLIDEDPDLRVILKPLPILTPGSMEAARVGVLVGRSDADYWDFHETLFTGRGQVDGTVALDAAETLGLDRQTLEAQMGDDSVAAVIQRSYAIAQALDVTGTPTYVMGDEIIPGAIGYDELAMRIANMRDCGSTTCT